MIKNVDRVLDLKSKDNFDESKGGLEGKKFDDVKKIVDDGRWTKNPTTFHVLAAAAPKLANIDGSHDILTVKDLFNTLVAAFTLAHERAGTAKFTINTGPIGCGAFGHDRNVVFVLQALAAEHVSHDQIKLKFWGYNDDSAKKAKDHRDDIHTEFGKLKNKNVEDLLKVCSSHKWS